MGQKPIPARPAPESKGQLGYRRIPQPPARDNTDAAVEVEDPYLTQMKYAEMAQCERCGVVYHESRWYKPDDLPARSAAKLGTGPMVTCPACRKIQDMFANGIVEVRGEFAMKHRDEIESLIRGAEKRRRERNPLERIMQVVEQDNGFDIMTTDEGLAFHIARQLERAYHGHVEYNFDGGNQNFLRAVWMRG